MSASGREAGAAGVPHASSSVAEVARYYDRNTKRFLLAGPGRGTYSLHRELWGPDVTTAAQAVDHINLHIADEIEARAGEGALVVVDFGCGVGGTLFHLGRRFPQARLHGVTVSPRQVEIAERVAGELGLAGRCSFTLGDFHVTDLGVRADTVVAIESLAHSHSVASFLASASRHLRPGGSLLVADDFLGEEAGSLDERRYRLVEQFRAGWRVPGVCTVESLAAAGAKHGLELDRVDDLTSLTRPGSRVRDRLAAALAPALDRLGLGRIPFCGNIIGGNALQIGLREGFLRYRLVIMRRLA